MGFLDSLFGNKKKIYQEALNSVDKVKVGLSNSLIHVCEYKFGKEYASSLISAIVNTIFSESPSSETGRLFLQNEDNINNVMLIIEKYIKPQENLMEGITEAVRVKCALSHSMNNNLSEPDFIRLCREPIDKLKRLGLLVSGGDMPDLPKFNQTAKVFFIVYGESIFPEIIFDQLSAQPIEERSVEHFLAEKMKFIESINRVNLPDHVPVKEESKMPNNPPKKVFVENNENPPFEYLKDNYSLDIDKYAEISDIIIDAATATSEQLEKESSYRASENLVHYFLMNYRIVCFMYLLNTLI